MPPLLTPTKPDRRRGLDGRFRCYKCPSELAVAGVREKCCRNCLVQLLKKTFAAEFAGLRRTLAEQQQQQNKCTGTSCEEGEACREDPPLFVGLSGGDASLSLMHVANELVQRRVRNRVMQREKKSREGSGGSRRKGPLTREHEADFGCCIALHVDMQRLFLRPANVIGVRVPISTQNHSPSEGHSASERATEREATLEAAYLLRLPAPAKQSLPLQIQDAVSRQWPAVRCVLLHPSGMEFSVVEDKQSEQHSGCYVEVYRQRVGKSCTREQLDAIVQQEEQLRQLLAQTFAEDKTATEHLCRAIMLRAVRQYFSRFLETASNSQGAHPAFLCVGDSASAAALGVLERVNYGEGRLLATESAPVDGRHLPLFHLCRPVVELSKKELALFRLFEGLPALPTRPYLLHEDILPISDGTAMRNHHPSVRWILQDFLVELEKGNCATIHNLLSASRKLEPTFTRWSHTDTPCCLCWKAPAAKLSQILGEQQVVTPRQLQIAEEYLIPNAPAPRLCFACFRDATAAASAAQIARVLSCDF